MGSEIETIAFFHINTTSIFEKNPDITELTIKAISTSQLLTYQTRRSRIVKELTLAFKTEKKMTKAVINISNLTNQELSREVWFDEKTCRLIDCFLKTLPGPVCFVAHNGDSFDYRILKQHFDAYGLVSVF